MIATIKIEAAHLNLDELEADIMSKIAQLKIRVYFKARFAILKDKYSPSPHKKRLRVHYIGTDKLIQEAFTPKKKKVKKDAYISNMPASNCRPGTINKSRNTSGPAIVPPSKFKGIRSRSTVHHDYVKVIYTNYPKS